MKRRIPHNPRSPRNPQLTLRLDGETPSPAGRWHDGASLAYLGGHVTLQLDTDRKMAMLEDGILHLPLPPAASPRQIQDGVEAWLRQEATRLIGSSVAQQARYLGRPEPRWALSFATRGGGGAQCHADGSLRFSWRLIEQPLATLEQVVGQAVATLPLAAAADTADLWGMRTE